MFTSINPATGETIATYDELTAAEIEARVQRAHDAFRRWRTSDCATRTDLLATIADAFEADKHRLAEIATREMGKTFKSALAEVTDSTGCCCGPTARSLSTRCGAGSSTKAMSPLIRTGVPSAWLASISMRPR